MSNPRFIGIYFEEQPSFISLEIESHRKAGTIRNITNDSVEVKFQTKDGMIFVKGSIVAHGGKYKILIHLQFNFYILSMYLIYHFLHSDLNYKNKRSPIVVSSFLKKT